MSRWDPDTPALAGQEYVGGVTIAPTLGVALGRGILIDAQSSSTVDGIAAYINPTVSGSSGNGVVVGADIYDLTANPTFVGEAQEWVMTVPGSHAGGGGSGVGIGMGWQKLDAGVFTGYDHLAYQNIDDLMPNNAPFAGGGQDYIAYNPPDAKSKKVMFAAVSSPLYDGDSGAAGSTISGKRVGWIDIVVVCQSTLPVGCTVDGVFTINGLDYGSDSGPVRVASGSGLRRLRFSYYWNPDALQDWSGADAADILAGTIIFGVTAAAQPSAVDGYLLVTSIMLQFRALPERRVAVAYTKWPLLGRGSWAAMSTLTVIGRAPAAWSKTAGHTYLLLWHLTGDGGSATMAGLAPSNVAGHEADALAHISARDLNLDVGGAIPKSLNANNIGARGVLLLNATTANVDSQPYVSASAAIRVGGTVASPPHGVVSIAAQRISTEGSALYALARLVLAVDPDGAGGTLQNAPLSVVLKTTGGGTLASGQVATTDLPADGRYYVVMCRLGAGASLTGQSVTLELTTASTVGWRTFYQATRLIGTQASDALSLAGAAVGAGGTTDFAAIGGTNFTEADFPFAIGTVPSPLGGLARSAATTPNRPALAGTVCRPATIGYVHLTWTPSSLGGNFGYYLVERADRLTQSAAQDWHAIAQITDESNAYFNDVEGPMGVAVSYRVRVVRADSTSSSTTAFTAVTIPVAAGDIAVLRLASNWAGDLAVAAQDTDPREWTFPESDLLVVKPIFGSRFPLAFRSPAGTGDAFTRTLVIAADADAALISGAVFADRAVFDSLIAVCSGPPAVPYVAVCDGYGRRWQTAPRVTGAHREKTWLYTATVAFTEVGYVPTPVVTATPWVPA